jgi:signal recognition particle subunit SRP54
MFDSLTDKLQQTFRNLTGRGILNESNIEEAMGEVRLALLDADVNYDIVKEFIDQVRQECLGEAVLKHVKPGQQVIKIVSDRLAELMGEANAPLDLHGSPATIMMIGLHGGGKTTTTGKLAAMLRDEGRRVLLVAADLYRPAAIDQLETLGSQLGVPVFSDRTTKDVSAIAEAARKQARHDGCDTMIVDTAGRLQIDEPLIAELVKLKNAVQPNEILLVSDAALGQEAVSVATEFNHALAVTGIILTKMDGDARGGAALSMRRVTGKPIKFVGIGEKLEDLEAFHPDRMANRILGMGDVLSLVEIAEKKISEEEAERLEQKMLKNQFDLSDFLTLLRQLQNLGGMGKVLELIPGGKNLLDNADIDEKRLKHVEAVIQSMTPYERQHPQVLGVPSRRQRIAKGAGRPLFEVQQLLKRFETMRSMMTKSKMGKLARMFGMGDGGMPDMAGMGGMPGMGMDDDDMDMGGLGGFGGGSAGNNKTLGQKAKKAKRKKNKKRH